jgi:hypothetical protein
MTAARGMDPATVAQAIQLGLVAPDEISAFLGGDGLGPPPDAVVIWRVRYWRKHRLEPTSSVFSTLAQARRHAKKASGYSSEGRAGRVTRIEIAECTIRPGTVIETRNLTAEPDPTEPPEPTPAVEESTNEETPHDDPASL